MKKLSRWAVVSVGAVIVAAGFGPYVAAQFPTSNPARAGAVETLRPGCPALALAIWSTSVSRVSATPLAAIDLYPGRPVTIQAKATGGNPPYKDGLEMVDRYPDPNTRPVNGQGRCTGYPKGAAIDLESGVITIPNAVSDFDATTAGMVCQLVVRVTESCARPQTSNTTIQTFYRAPTR
jgi:hypothetical protein